MRKHYILINLLLFGPIQSVVLAQNDSAVWNNNLKEVIVTAGVGDRQRKAAKGGTASIDDLLGQLSNVNLVRRGSYAFEPLINNMAEERISVTIDGMKIFYACTDRMDPVTSYVESGNLQKISLSSGLAGNPQATSNIGGSLDLKLRRVGFDKQAAVYHAAAGYESNGNNMVYSADAQFSGHELYSNFGISFRHAGNYNAGGGEEILYSQYQKTNTFFNIGYQPAENHIIEGSFIYDIARNVGYPALAMDVKKASALIAAVSYRHENIGAFFNRWETKLYTNDVRHIMDDTKRPVVLIHMDMPGKSRTSGIYSLLEGHSGRHSYQLNYDLYYNRLFADMTMYPENGSSMYMLTWPDIGTLNTGISLSDNFRINEYHSLNVSLKGAWQQQKVNNEEGLDALRIYFPDMGNTKTEAIYRSFLGYAFGYSKFHITAGVGYGNRAPSVTESFGYFINNILDKYDYIGNPKLKNESALELNGSMSWADSKVNLKAEADAFFFHNYIIGLPDDRLSAMTIGAAGVKVYQNLSHAKIVNFSFLANWNILDFLRWENIVSYIYGVESNGIYLPMMAPVTYKSAFRIIGKLWEAKIGMESAACHSNYSAKYGETETPGYAVFDINGGYKFVFRTFTVDFHAGIENVLDHRYTTYSDWNSIPKKGRNIYVNATFTI